MAVITSTLLILAAFVDAVVGQTGDTGWDELRTTWSATTFTGFYSVPITVSDVKSKSWTEMLTCNDVSKHSSPGIVYADDGDLSSMPFYNADGYIAGIILGMINPGSSSETAPFKKYTLENGTTFWGIEAHFRDPTTTCKSNNPANSNGTVGDRLWFANGNDGTYFGIPLTEDTNSLSQKGWYQGKCFINMGEHYWRYISSDMDCDDTYPIFLLYNSGKLNAWGIAMAHSDRPYLSSFRWEHPAGSELEYFFQSSDFPQCLLDDGTLSTQHVYMTYPFYNTCL